MDRRLPFEHPTWLEFSEIDAQFVGSNAYLAQLRETVDGWGVVDDDDENGEEEVVEGRDTAIEPVVSAPVVTEPLTLTLEEEVNYVGCYFRAIS